MLFRSTATYHHNACPKPFREAFIKLPPNLDVLGSSERRPHARNAFSVPRSHMVRKNRRPVRVCGDERTSISEGVVCKQLCFLLGNCIISIGQRHALGDSGNLSESDFWRELAIEDVCGAESLEELPVY